MSSIEQVASMNAQRVYFSRRNDQMAQKIADGDLSGLHHLGPFTEAQAGVGMEQAALSNQGEIFDYLFENYTANHKSRNGSVISFSTFGDLKRIKRILDTGNITELAKIQALGNAVIGGHKEVVSRLLELGSIQKSLLQGYAQLSEDEGHRDLAGFFRNVVDGLS